MLPIDTARKDLVEEFRRQPFGPHSPDLQLVLNRLRAEPLAGRYTLIATQPKREWMIATLSGERGKPPELVSDKRYTDPAAAEWAVFKLRWQRATGETLPDEAAVEEAGP
jgi:hypothetical protein